MTYFYRRYVDDGIIVFNSVSELTYVYQLSTKLFKKHFSIKISLQNTVAKTRLNGTKTKYISVRDLVVSNSSDSFDFLGYQFVLSPKIDSHNKIKTTFKYGITQDKNR